MWKVSLNKGCFPMVSQKNDQKKSFSVGNLFFSQVSTPMVSQENSVPLPSKSTEAPQLSPMATRGASLAARSACAPPPWERDPGTTAPRRALMARHQPPKPP